MAQRKLLISGLKIGYEGLFDVQDFLKLIDDWFKQYGYEKAELTNIERVKNTGKVIDLDLLPTKKITDFVKYEMSLRVRIENLTETTVKKDDQKFKINKGNVSLEINAFLTTDLENEWESKPMFYFFRALMDKYFNKKYMSQYEKGLTTDVQILHSELKSYFNLSRLITHN